MGGWSAPVSPASWRVSGEAFGVLSPRGPWPAEPVASTGSAGGNRLGVQRAIGALGAGRDDDVADLDVGEAGVSSPAIR